MSLGAAIPQLFVTDIDRAIRWFGTLGFAEVFRHGDPAFYAQVARDAAWLNLRHVDAPLLDPAVAAREEYLAASITVEDAEALAAEFEAAGAALHRPLTRRSWGAQDFVLRDPDGNLLLFAGPG
ncbi:VOC family protein [Paracraurococcus lichenis]|uniref:VOC family protein n=1 Tax=Paracraurococcus lichenis TaxID=3064888 RepID=A0ABT9E197_9PROT|nr:VOC family protein [Paracraurococcus sp. LOR1-02]MDO9709941.1 VOC family protein [Paracraurococcus sp. LOR1-02]